MTIASNVKKIIDLPSWEWVRAAPAVTAASATTASGAVSDWKSYFVGGTPRYAYYLVGAALYRYDTWNDSWHQLASMTVTPVYCASVEYSPNAGYYGFAIGPGPGRNTIQLAGLDGDTLVGQKIAIIAGTGAGQERTIVEIRDQFIHDSGNVTTYAAGPNPASIQDASTLTQRKTWMFNQWRNYQMRIAYASTTGSNQIRKILRNDNSSLIFSDYNFALFHSWYAAPLSTAVVAAQSWYQIESSIACVDSKWDVRPDETSMFVVKGGGLWLHTGLASGAFYTLAYYDILADVWYYKGTQTATLYSNTWDTFENALEVVTEAEGGATTDWSHATPLTSKQGTISVGTAPYDRRTLIDSGQNMNPNQFANQMIKITSGTGRGQSRTIVGNNRTTFIVSRDWDTNPDSTSIYQVIGDSDKMYVLPGRTQSVMGIYSIENDMMTTGRQFDYGVAKNYILDLQYKMIATVSVTNGGTGGTYAVGDILTLTNNGLFYGLNGQVIVESVIGSQVATVSLWSAGRGYVVHDTSYETTGGGGTGCTIKVLSNGIPSIPQIDISGTGSGFGGLISVSVNAPGSGYSVGDLLTLNQTGSGGVIRVTGVNSSGGLTSISIEVPGISYLDGQTSTTIYTITSAGASGCKNAAASDGGFRAAATGAVINTIQTNGGLQIAPVSHNAKIGDIVFLGGVTRKNTWAGLRPVNGVTTTQGLWLNSGPPAVVAANITPTVFNGALNVATVNSGGTGYSVGDELTLTTGGTNGKVRVVAVNSGAVTAISLLYRGYGYSAGTSTTTGGGNNDCVLDFGTLTGGILDGPVVVNSPGKGYGTLTNTTPPYTYTLGTGLGLVTVYDGGSGYAVGDELLVSGGINGILRVGAVDNNGTVLSLGYSATSWGLINNTGSGYSVGIKTTTTIGNSSSGVGPPSGTGCRVSVDLVGEVATAGGGIFSICITNIDSSGGILNATVTYLDVGGFSPQSHNVDYSFGGTTDFCNSSKIVDQSKNWIPNEHLGKLVQVQSAGVAQTAQMRRIMGNSYNKLAISTSTTINAGSTKYVIFDPKSLGTETTYKCVDCSQYSWGIATGGTVNTLVDNPLGLGVINVIIGGTGYSVGDILTLSGGTGGTVKVLTATSGAVTAVSVITQGTGYTASTTSTTTVSPTGGTGCTLYIYTLNSKNWDVNRWAGYKVKIVAGTGSNSLPNELLIASNTANTLTLATNFTFSVAPDSTTVYSIMDNYGVCTGDSTSNGGMASATISVGGTGYRVGDIVTPSVGSGGYLKVSSVSAGGVVTGVQVINPGSNYIANFTFPLNCLTNAGASSCQILTGAIGTAVGGTTIINDPYQNWGANATTASGPLVNKMVRIVAGAPVIGLDSAIVNHGASPVSTQITIAALATAPDGNSAYSILGISPRSVAASVGVSSLHRLWGTSVIEKSRYMVSWRGNATPSIDRYDIVQNMWETLSPTPLSETFTVGSMFIYNGRDRIYFTTGVTGRVQYYDFVLNKIIPCGTIPYAHGTGIQGNRMFVMSSVDLDGNTVDCLYVMRHTGQEMWRSLIY